MSDPVADIMTIAYEVAGINLSANKRSMVEGRLGKRLRQLNCGLGAYVERVRKDPKELMAMLDLLTTNHTAWRREPGHFDDLEGRVLPDLAKAQKSMSRPRLRVWCAAAATGEEPWTIALSLVRAIPNITQWDVAMLATDISTRALERAKAGRYDEGRIEALSVADRALAVEQVEPGPPAIYAVKPQLRALVNFARLNLMEPWPIKGFFDCIFCRNVMIYFDHPTQERLVNRMAGLLSKGGTLYVGHSESLSAISHPLRAIGPAAYVA
ncbi:MAG TPA: CheR family methyltransferase [Planctomycetota bacterium]|nr:CheR family methyltransferase [Planctomycetota bacterium]